MVLSVVPPPLLTASPFPMHSSSANEARDQVAKAKAKQDRVKSFLFTSKFCGLILLFVMYRAYRGFFVILPEVFREVHRKLSIVMDFSPYEDDSISAAATKTVQIFRGEKEKGNRGGGTESESRVITTEPRYNKITVSVLACIITISYTLRGLAGVAFKFLQTISINRSLKNSFEAAADEFVVNEDRIMRVVENGGNKPQE